VKDYTRTSDDCLLGGKVEREKKFRKIRLEEEFRGAKWQKIHDKCG